MLLKNVINESYHHQGVITIEVRQPEHGSSLFSDTARLHTLWSRMRTEGNMLRKQYEQTEKIILP